MKFEKLQAKLGLKQAKKTADSVSAEFKSKKITKVAKKSFRNIVGDLYHTKRL